VSNYLENFWDRRRTEKKLSSEEKEKLIEKNLEEQRQKVINFKKFFGTDEGREVMLDLMNRFHLLTPLPDGDAITLARCEGKREVVLYLLGRANTSIEQLDKILKGEFV
jgi:hypothetical protein